MPRLCLVLAITITLAGHGPALGAAASAVLLPPIALDAPPESPLDLAALWELALVHNPSLREAEAEAAAARGRLIQARAYPNPGFSYEEESIGTKQAAAGNLRLQVTQEIVTGGKRRLDIAVARRGTDGAALALAGRRFAVLTAIRRAYFDYLGLVYTLRQHEDVVAKLEEGVALTQKLVQQVKSRPLTDLLRLEALLAEAKTNQGRARINLTAAWRQLAAEVGVPELPPPLSLGDLPPVPSWQADAVLQRVLTASTDLQQAGVETERARLQWERARAEAVPNVTLGGGYNHNYAEGEVGGVISLQAALPLWDRKQGQIHEAQAKWAFAQAAQRGNVMHLHRDTAEAFGRYQGARDEVERLTREALPRLVRSFDLVRQGYQAGSAQISFADVLLAQETLNDVQLKLAQARRELWRAVADLQGLMQLDLGEELGAP